VFGPDGYLWIGLGDGGASGDRFQNAQNPGTLLGSMLRIDVDGAEPYGVPADNPFVNDPTARSEVWAIGLRNPWRYSFDSETGDLYIADVGQGEWEEISIARAGSTGGENYGWPITEGSHCYGTDSCTTDGLVQPVIEYDHAGGNCAITGGYVYRGSASPGLWGTYLYADYCSGNFWGLQLAEGGTESRLFFQRDRALFSSFGQDENGELYILSIEAGAVFHIVAF
jgi:glucose/arabinose dehydrogenase